MRPLRDSRAAVLAHEVNAPPACPAAKSLSLIAFGMEERCLGERHGTSEVGRVSIKACPAPDAGARQVGPFDKLQESTLAECIQKASSVRIH